MNINSFDEYKNYYFENNKLPYPQTTWNPNKKFTDRELQSKYRDYCLKIEKQNEKREEKIIDTKIKLAEQKLYGVQVELSEYAQKVQNAMKESKRLDPNHLVWKKYYMKLSADEQIKIEENMWQCPKDGFGQFAFDSAHIISRSESPKLAYEVRNIIQLPRFFHSKIDNYLDVFDNKLTKEQHDRVWIDLVGQETWDWLMLNK